MSTFPFVTLDVFTDTRFGGNPLAVFTDARGLSAAQMQALAAEMNLSETTFILPPEDPANTARVRVTWRVQLGTIVIPKSHGSPIEPILRQVNCSDRPVGRRHSINSPQ